MNQEITEIITRILNGTAAIEEYKILTAWMNENEQNAKEFSEQESLWLALDIISNREKFKSEKGFLRFKDTLWNRKNTNRLKTGLQIPFYLKVAAFLILILGLSIISYWTGRQSGNKQISYYELFTPKGSKSHLSLPDGTKIWLNAGSKLRYPNEFKNNTREVYLDGEGYFEVAKDAGRPFVVRTSEINIRVLGTVFNVKSYSNEGTIETTLISGSVIIEGNKQNSKTLLQLLPNEKATYLKKTGKVLLNDKEQQQIAKTISDNKKKSKELTNIFLSEQVNTDIYTSWKDNLLVFDNEPFESIAYKLERRYGAIIKFNNPKVKNYRFSGTFPEISIDRALKALQYASPFDYKIKRDSIFIGN